VARKSGKDILIHVKVLPRSSRDQIVGKENDVFKIKLKAGPVDGKANKSLINFLSKKLDISKRDVGIKSGERSRQKVIWIHGLSENDTNKRLGVNG
jgi:uncharacterized protein (TIGR00251 family)